MEHVRPDRDGARHARGFEACAGGVAIQHVKRPHKQLLYTAAVPRAYAVAMMRAARRRLSRWRTDVNRCSTDRTRGEEPASRHDRHAESGPRRRLRRSRRREHRRWTPGRTRRGLRACIRDRADHTHLTRQHHDRAVPRRPRGAAQRHTASTSQTPTLADRLSAQRIRDRRIRGRVPAGSAVRADQGIPDLRRPACRAAPTDVRRTSDPGRARRG